MGALTRPDPTPPETGTLAWSEGWEPALPEAAAGDVESPKERVRTADVIASLCLATDLGMGFPFEHGFLATLTTMRLCDVMGVDAETAKVTYFVSLLMYSGCTVDGEERSRVFGGSLRTSSVRYRF